MDRGAHSPEELDLLLEDALVLQCPDAVRSLFTDAGVLAGRGLPAARGAAIGSAAAALWTDGHCYVGGASEVVRAGDTALVVTPGATEVARRGPDGVWRLAICLLHPPVPEEDPMSDHTTALVPPAATRKGEGEALWWLGETLAEVTLTAAQSGGALSVIEITEPPGATGPLHVHHREDETFYILEGGVTLQVADETIEAGPGDVVFGPRGVPHRYTVGDAGCRMLFIMTPGGFEDLVRDMSVPAERRTLPPAPDGEPDWARVAEIARAHGCELLD